MLLRLASVVAVLALYAPAFGITVFSPPDPSLQGTVVASQTVSIFPNPVSSDPQFLVDEKVVLTAEGTLDFYYKVLNPPSRSTTLRDFGVEFPASNSLQLISGYLNEGNLAPSTGLVAINGSITDVSYHFGPDGEIVGVPIPDAGTDWLLLRSNATAFTIGFLGGDNGQDDLITPATGFAPDANSVPEPASLALISLGILGLAIKFRCPVAAITPRPSENQRGLFRSYGLC